MKDLQFKDILNRAVRPLTLLSVYRNGRWSFATPTALIKTVNQQQYYLISETFGLVKQGTNNPKFTAARGKPGDYVARDKTGVYALVTADYYKLLFPPANANPPAVPDNSEKLKNPNFITNILKGSKPTVSNSTTIKPSSPSTGY